MWVISKHPNDSHFHIFIIITIQPGLQWSSFAHFIIPPQKKDSLENCIFSHLFEASCRHLILHFNVVLLSVPCTKTAHVLTLQVEGAACGAAARAVCCCHWATV